MEGAATKEFEVAKYAPVGTCDWVLRLLALVLTLVAAVVAGVNTQTAVVPIKLVDSLPPLDVPATAKWHYLSAYV